MAVVVADMSVSLDGFVADRSYGVEHVFSWYAKPQPAPAADRQDTSGVGVIVYGRLPSPVLYLKSATLAGPR